MDGEFGGPGDDSDFTNLFLPRADGYGAEKLKSLSQRTEAMYENKMWTNGWPQAVCELHSYEDGLNVLASR